MTILCCILALSFHINIRTCNGVSKIFITRRVNKVSSVRCSGVKITSSRDVGVNLKVRGYLKSEGDGGIEFPKFDPKGEILQKFCKPPPPPLLRRP